MEAVGLAIGIIAVIKPTAEAIIKLWSDTKNFGGDVERFRLRFSVQMIRLGCFERVLFEPNKYPLVQGKLFDQLPENVRDSFVQLLKQLYELLQKYFVMHERYSLEVRSES